MTSYLALLSSLVAAASQQTPNLETVAEQSGFRRTGRYEEVQRLCAAYPRAWPDAVRCHEFGKTPEGRPLLALVASRTGALTPEDARKQGIPVMLIQGGIHAGEIDGKDAGFLALRELLQNKAAPRALDSFVLVFVPVLNVDGHERFGPWNRPNQNGPEEMGWRVTSQNLNLNRDYTKADAPEMQSLLRLLEAWDPILYADLHVTDGAQFEHDVANLMEPIYIGDTGLQSTGRDVLGELNRKLEAQGSFPITFYPLLVREDDPTSGFKQVPSMPRFSTAYWALRNRFALLVETHSWKSYSTRVRITRNTIVALAEIMTRDGRRLHGLGQEADTRAQRLGGQDVTIEYQTGEHVMTIDFRGNAYTREPSAVSGALTTRYDSSKPQIWRVPFWDTVVPKTTVRAPRAGYVVPAAHAEWMASRLSAHGIAFEQLPQPANDAAVETFRAETVVFSKAPFEGRTTVELGGRWQPDTRLLPAGSLFVPLAQARARLVMTLLEPQSPDSFAAWGFFNVAFEAREYMEPYVADQVGREMLAKDPQVAAAFSERLANDPKFAGDPAARLEFFHQRHPSWDERRNLYPVYRVDVSPIRSEVNR
jgi:hypothetical protein